MKKKILLFLTLIIVTGTLTGCGTKTLSCTKTDKSLDDMTMTQKSDISFSGKKSVKLYTESKVEVSGIYKKYKKQMETSIMEQFKVFKGKKGIAVKSEQKGDTILVKATININKLDKETRKIFTMIDTTADFKKAKKQFEDQGFICK